MVHLLLQALAERTAPNGTLLFCFWERDLPDTVAHAVLLHHGVGHTCHLAQVILSSWGHRKKDAECLNLIKAHSHTIQV